MDWVKLTTDYYRDAEIAVGSDAAEVMFTRGLALAGEIERHGFIPDAMVPGLTRKPVQAKKIAGELVKADLWEKVRGGYQIANWDKIQAELEKIVERKKRDRERKRAERAASRELSEDVSADGPATRPGDRLSGESKSKRTTAAARTEATRPNDLPPAVVILRGALEAHKLFVRWDRLTSDQLVEIEDLIDRHGDAALVSAALRDYQPNKPAAYASAWLAGWRELRSPGDLALVAAEPCDEPGHTGTTKHCKECASERKAAR